MDENEFGRSLNQIELDIIQSFKIQGYDDQMILDALNWSDNEDIVILTEGDKLIIKKAHPHTRKNIKELFADYKDNYTPIDVDWGKPEGKEIW